MRVLGEPFCSRFVFGFAYDDGGPRTDNLTPYRKQVAQNKIDRITPRRNSTEGQILFRTAFGRVIAWNDSSTLGGWTRRVVATAALAQSFFGRNISTDL